jgi:hypothetical protein
MLRSVLLASSMLLTAPAMAAPPDGGRYVYVPPGATVVVVPASRPMAADFPVARVFARQDAMMQRMMADMDTLMAMPLPDPQQMIRSVMSGMPQVPAGSGVVTTFFSNGSQTCSQTITYGSAANGGQPVVKVSSSGNGCGVVRPSGPISVAQPAPAPKPVTPPHERLWTIGYPPHAVPVHVPPRT